MLPKIMDVVPPAPPKAGVSDHGAKSWQAKRYRSHTIALALAMSTVHINSYVFPKAKKRKVHRCDTYIMPSLVV